MHQVRAHDTSVRKILAGIVGVSPAMVRLRRAVRRISRCSENVLIAGEAGVGKRFLANKIHDLSENSQLALVELDCSLYADASLNGAFAETLQSKVSAAPGGSVLLRRVEDLPLEKQAQLLSLLDKQLESSVGLEMPRVMATTETEPARIFENGLLKSKLFTRLSQITLHVPPLRARRQDIPALFEHFLNRMTENGQAEDLLGGIDDSLYESMLSYEWKGNTEELENAVRSLVITTRDGQLMPEALPFLRGDDPLKHLQGKSLPEAIAEVEKYLLQHALGRFEGNQTKAARYLQISEASLRYKLKKYEITNKS